MKTSSTQSAVQGCIIPLGRPALGRDLELLRNKLGCSVKHMLAAFGISSRNKWKELTDKKGNDPLQDAGHALLIRFYDRYPQYFPREHGLTIGDVLANLAAHSISVSASRFAVLVGRSKTVGPKWQDGTQPDPSANAAINIIDMLCKQNNLELWLEVVEDEAIARRLIAPNEKRIGADIQDRLNIDSWGGRGKSASKIKDYPGIERRKDTSSPLPKEIERRRTA